ncbi:iron chelate uptake ABC transporter family permease subunit, partial [Leucobacter sp. M11]|uniref:iron chelate uptake ABC transporter family permease subunit n=1 Tax=Leucobacter sp. M11 TaxID=2993565 RepID=UPI002D7FDF8D
MTQNSAQRQSPRLPTAGGGTRPQDASTGPAAPETPAARRGGRWRWAAAAALGFGILLAALAAGDMPLRLGEVWAALTGEAEPFTRTVVLSWRLPRALAALAFGAALGAAGAIFQALTRNPLGSPDVIGFNTGAYTGVL